ncbi:MAG: hypothetical protein IMF18_03155 [Proteobacteria bacterium]|nr:hypothetical protein [Pseudomonadota bacterium]
MEHHTEFLSMLSTEFHMFLMENEDLAKSIPPNALIIFEVEGEDDFNSWHERVSLKNREPNQPAVYVSVNRWRHHSLLKECHIRTAAA